MAKTSSAMRRSSAMSAGGNATVTKSGSMAYVGWMNDYAKLKSDIESPLNLSLNVSERQQQYASDIVNKAMARAITEDQTLRMSDPTFAMTSDQIDVMTKRIESGKISFEDAIGSYSRDSEKNAPVLQALKQAVTKAFSGITSASEVINKRDSFSQYGKISQAIRNVRSKFKKIHEGGREFTIDAAAKHILQAYKDS